MKHNHRILPGHMGGEYVEGNVISVEVTRCGKNTANHVMWHYANWCLHGKEEDRIAYRGLSGYYGKEDIVEELIKLGRERIDREKIGRTLKAKFETNPELRSERSEQIKQAFEELSKADPEWKERRRKAIAEAGGGTKSVEVRKEGKIGMFDNAWQKEMGIRAGKKHVENRTGFLHPDVIRDPIRKARGGRASCLSRQGVKLNKVIHYPESFGYRCCLSSDFVNYYVHYGLPKF